MRSNDKSGDEFLLISRRGTSILTFVRKTGNSASLAQPSSTDSGSFDQNEQQASWSLRAL